MLQPNNNPSVSSFNGKVTPVLYLVMLRKQREDVLQKQRLGTCLLTSVTIVVSTATTRELNISKSRKSPVWAAYPC